MIWAQFYNNVPSRKAPTGAFGTAHSQKFLWEGTFLKLMHFPMTHLHLNFQFYKNVPSGKATFLKEPLHSLMHKKVTKCVARPYAEVDSKVRLLAFGQVTSHSVNLNKL